MTAAGNLRELLSPVRHVLLDFDGPVCSVFSEFPAPQVAAQVRAWLAESEVSIAGHWEKEDDPLALLRLVSSEQPDLTARTDQMLAQLEAEAARRAEPTEGAERLVRACAATGRQVHIVSNNAGPAIHAYLAGQDLHDYVTSVVGRVAGDPDSMKPSPRLIVDAMSAAGAEPREAIFVGDAVRDVEAGHAAGIRTIGYANKAGKREKLAAASAVAVVESIPEITEALIDRA